jgi:bacterioferritin (cytochrome b1)
MEENREFAINAALKMIDQNKDLNIFKEMVQDPAYNQHYFDTLIEALDLELKMQEALVEKIKHCKDLSDIITFAQMDETGELQFVDEEHDLDLHINKDDLTGFGNSEIRRLRELREILKHR